MISVLVPVNRVGGLDVLFESLARQTFTDFELLLVDAIYEQRRDLVAARAASYPFKTVHLPPWGNNFPFANYCRSLNVGLAHARGSLVVYFCDYTWVNSDCLAEHWAFQQRHPGAGLMLTYTYRKLPEVAPSFPGYGPGILGVVHTDEPEAKKRYDDVQDAAANTYADDLAQGHLNDLLWSLFKVPVTDEAQVRALETTLVHAKNAVESPQDPNYCSLKNESIPLDLLLDANGHDEDFDASHGWQDSEICHRLVHRHGMQWWGKSGGEVAVVDPRPIFYFRKQLKPTGFNGALLQDKTIGDPGRAINPGYQLRDLRKWIHPGR